MRYGYFDDDNKEYIITDPRTPVKWINYIGTLDFGGFVDNTGGALICSKDPAINRITRYITILPDSEMKGETLYLRIKDEDEKYKVFSPFYVPTLDNYHSYKCQVGLQYTKFTTVFYNIQTEVTCFVPLNSKVEIRKIKITNLSDKIISIDLIPVVEYTHFDALKQLTNADWVPQTMQSKAEQGKDRNIILTQFAFMNKESSINYFTANHKISSFETDRKLFLGNNGYGTWQNPGCLKNKELLCTETVRGDNIGALMIHLETLKPNESKTVITQLGQTEKLENSLENIIFFNNKKNADKAFSEIKTFWNEYLSKFKVETPSKEINSMINIHNPKQCYITKNWSRYLSLYQLGYGARGIGFRDSCQDVLAVTPYQPDEVKKFLIKILQTQKSNGSAMHQFNPLSMEATMGDAEEDKKRPQCYSDDHLWAVLAVCKYLKETGNITFLDKEIQFYKSKKDNIIEKGTVFEHLKRSLNFTEYNKGRNNIPLLGFADWNDTFNLPKGAESILTAGLYGLALKEFIELLKFLREEKLISIYKKRYQIIKETINAKAWDGEWFIRYFDHNGNPVGSKHNEKGKIFINAQSWPIIAGFADKDRINKALDSVNKYLNTDFGIKISTPSYNGYDPVLGGITTYPTGAKENGGIFLHTNPWIIIAETIRGDGERAYQYYNQINPASKNDIIDKYECEPYCFAQNILSDEHPQFGLARNSWLTGTASWSYQALTEYILGIRTSYYGLLIDPCIPKDWTEFKAVRIYKGKTYNITVKNPNSISKGKVELHINDKIINSNIIPDNINKEIIDVIAILK